MCLILLTAFFCYHYIDNTFINFENEYVEKTNFRVLNIEGHTFLDRNDNGSLDIYEDDRESIENRVNNLLSLMTLDEKIHLHFNIYSIFNFKL